MVPQAATARSLETLPARPPTPAPAPLKRPRAKPRKSLPVEGTDDAVAAKLKTTSISAPPKRRGRQPKTKETVDDSEPEGESGAAAPRGRKMAHASSMRSASERPHTRSVSRTRPETSPARVAGAFKPGHKAQSRSRTKMAEVVNGDSDADEADDEQPKKKRKVAAQ